jgi:hypothetical protein
MARALGRDPSGVSVIYPDDYSTRPAEADIQRGAASLDATVEKQDAENQAAIDAVREWTFTPTLLNGVPVPVVFTVTVQFRLQ